MKSAREIALEMWGEEGFSAYGRLLDAARAFGKATNCPLGACLLTHAAKESDELIRRTGVQP